MAIKETREVELVSVDTTETCMVQLSVARKVQELDVDDAMQLAEELLAAARQANQWKQEAVVSAAGAVSVGSPWGGN